MDLKTVREVEDSELSPEAFTTKETLLLLPVMSSEWKLRIWYISDTNTSNTNQQKLYGINSQQLFSHNSKPM